MNWTIQRDNLSLLALHDRFFWLNQNDQAVARFGLAELVSLHALIGDAIARVIERPDEPKMAEEEAP